MGAMRRVALAAALGLAATAWAAPGAATAQEVDLAQLAKTPSSLLFWTIAQRDAAFRAMEKVFPTHVMKRGFKVSPLPAGKPLPALAWTHDGAAQTLEGFMAAERTAAVMVVQDGRVRLERYGLGYGAAGRWTSFSMAKSLTSTLVGAAVRDGLIKSVDDPIARYLPELKGSAYDGVSIRQVLTMTSGVKWSEDYTDPKSDVALSGNVVAPPGRDPVLMYMSKLPREAPPGSKWVYKTGETNLIGVLVTRVTGKTLAQYASEKIWARFGMEQDARWMHLSNGQDFGGCCVSAAAHDYARIGQFVLAGGRGVVPDGWFAAATTKQADIGAPGFGYGYQWWTWDDGSFDARGIFGQLIHIDPKRRLVVVVNSDWPVATGKERSAARMDFLKAVIAAVDQG